TDMLALLLRPRHVPGGLSAAIGGHITRTKGKGKHMSALISHQLVAGEHSRIAFALWLFGELSATLERVLDIQEGVPVNRTSELAVVMVCGPSAGAGTAIERSLEGGGQMKGEACT